MNTAFSKTHSVIEVFLRPHRRKSLLLYAIIGLLLFTPVGAFGSTLMAGYWERRVEFFVNPATGWNAWDYPGAPPLMLEKPATALPPYIGWDHGSMEAELSIDGNPGPWLFKPTIWLATGSSNGGAEKSVTLRVIWVYVPFGGVRPDDVLTDDHIAYAGETQCRVSGTVSASGEVINAEPDPTKPPKYYVWSSGYASLVLRHP